jgi:hypothetical protein
MILGEVVVEVGFDLSEFILGEFLGLAEPPSLALLLPLLYYAFSLLFL